MKEYFCGYYFKHQKENDILSVICGKTGKEKFIQVIKKDFSGYFPFTDGNAFSKKGIKLNLKSDNFEISGKVLYNNLTPLKYDIMGPFAFLPMECSHGILSLHHDLYGGFTINGQYHDFTGGVGYIEKDSGKSFPKSYLWLHCNDFNKKASISLSIAEIPFFNRNFTGCICAIWYKGKEYRIATYLCGKTPFWNENKVVLTQRDTVFIADIENGGNFLPLQAPNKGDMTRTITESLSAKARFRLYKGEKLIFDLTSEHCGFEYVR